MSSFTFFLGVIALSGVPLVPFVEGVIFQQGNLQASCIRGGMTPLSCSECCHGGNDVGGGMCLCNAFTTTPPPSCSSTTTPAPKGTPYTNVTEYPYWPSDPQSYAWPWLPTDVDPSSTSLYPKFSINKHTAGCQPTAPSEEAKFPLNMKGWVCGDAQYQDNVSYFISAADVIATYGESKLPANMQVTTSLASCEAAEYLKDPNLPVFFEIDHFSQTTTSGHSESTTFMSLCIGNPKTGMNDNGDHCVVNGRDNYWFMEFMCYKMTWPNPAQGYPYGPCTKDGGPSGKGTTAAFRKEECTSDWDFAPCGIRGFWSVV